MNESSEYASGRGETVWLKPEEGVRFQVTAGDTNEYHTIHVKSLGDGEATVVVASTDPQEVTIKQGKSVELDVSGDFQNDIFIKLVGIADGQAGLEVRPLSEETKVAALEQSDDQSSSDQQSPSRTWIYVLLSVLLLLAIAFAVLTYKGITPKIWRRIKRIFKKDKS